MIVLAGVITKGKQLTVYGVMGNVSVCKLRKLIYTLDI